MGVLDVFKRKDKAQKESNTLFGQTALGNNILRNVGSSSAFQQMLYVTTSSATQAGRTVDMSVLSRNSTVMSCLAVKARALSQLPVRIVAYNEKDELVDACHDASIGARDKIKARQVYNLLANPNNFQSQYEFWYQFSMWLDMAALMPIEI